MLINFIAVVEKFMQLSQAKQSECSHKVGLSNSEKVKY